MNVRSALVAAALVACSGRIEVYQVAPDQKHVLIGSGTSIRSIEVETLAEVGSTSDVYPGVAFFSRDGSKLVARSTHHSLVVAPTGGGKQVDFGPAIDLGTISIDGTRVAFLQNPSPCSEDRQFGCAELFSAPSTGGEAIRIASGIRVAMSDNPYLLVPAALMDYYLFAGNDTLVFTNGHDVMTVPADGSVPASVLAPGVIPFPGHDPIPPIFWILRDGRVVVQDGAGLVLMNARGGAPVRLADGDSTQLLCMARPDSTMDFSCPLSPAGSLAISSPSTQSISTVRVLSLTGGASFTVSASGVILFDSDGRLIFFDPDGFLSAALPSGEVRQLGNPAVEGYPGLSSPDGKWVPFSSPMQQVTVIGSGSSTSCVNCDRLQLLSTVTGTTWRVTAGGKPLALSRFAFSPDSTSVLLQTPDRKLLVAPVGGGEPRTIEGDVDQADWAGTNRIVVSRTRSSPAGVHFVEVR
jgi:hypothetical protein